MPQAYFAHLRLIILYIMYLPSVIAFGNFEPHGFAAERLW